MTHNSGPSMSVSAILRVMKVEISLLALKLSGSSKPKSLVILYFGRDR